jgi:hypothetical protein
LILIIDPCLRGSLRKDCSLPAFIRIV